MIFNRTYLGYESPTPTGNPWLTFFGTSQFFIKTYSNSKTWDGIIEWSVDKITWSEWDGTNIYSAQSEDQYVIYLRGKNNTYITGNTYEAYKGQFQFYNSEYVSQYVSCDGSIEALLDYRYENPQASADNYCFAYMFAGSKLVSPPTLPSVTVSKSCYYNMFKDCCYLEKIPKLPATDIKVGSYMYMFYGCSSLKVSTIQTSECVFPFRMPESGTGTTMTNSLESMFYNTGGTYTDTPVVNTTYYTNLEPV